MALFSATYNPNPALTKDQFLQRVETDPSTGCWNWKLGKSPDGYGKATYYRKTWRSHRLFYTLWKGDIPKGLQVCHTCDNPICCNPSHLWLGYGKDNLRDRNKKGRATQRKLSVIDALRIRKHRENGVSYYKMAKWYKVNIASIRQVCLRIFFTELK